jgi:hypothetical protein
VQEGGLKRQIALAKVPDQKLPLQIELARFYESRNRVGDAQAVFEQLHATNPKSLGLIQDLEASTGAISCATVRLLCWSNPFRSPMSITGSSFSSTRLRSSAR